MTTSDYRRLRKMIAIDKKRRTSSHVLIGNHSHEHFELIYLQKGQCTFLAGDTSYKLTDGDLLVIPPNLTHASRYEGKGFHDRYAIHFDFRKADPRIISFLPFRQESPEQCLHFSAIPERKPEIEASLSAMLNMFHQNDEYSDTMLHFMFQQFLLLLGPAFAEASVNHSHEGTEISLLESARYIEAHFSEDISLSEIASFAGFSPSYFSRKFKAITGQGFRQFRDEIRLKNAASLLRDTDLSISEIAGRCGYSSSTYFGDSFRAYYGISPSGYRSREEV